MCSAKLRLFAGIAAHGVVTVVWQCPNQVAVVYPGSRQAPQVSLRFWRAVAERVEFLAQFVGSVDRALSHLCIHQET